uniref:Uncharacterized protein n=1 Tax=Pipistrellus kuhlii TaxID=59472 RepID=A0A7J7UA63_PIPKU|nr:hypothetical protein mPipKuh1_009165 [Pipistrellus kuhlii]
MPPSWFPSGCCILFHGSHCNPTSPSPVHVTHGLDCKEPPPNNLRGVEGQGGGMARRCGLPLGYQLCSCALRKGQEQGVKWGGPSFQPCVLGGNHARRWLLIWRRYLCSGPGTHLRAPPVGAGRVLLGKRPPQQPDALGCGANGELWGRPAHP